MGVPCNLVWSKLRVNWIVILTWVSIQTCLNFIKPPEKRDRQCQSKIKPKLLSLFAQQAQETLLLICLKPGQFKCHYSLCQCPGKFWYKWKT